MGFQTSLWEQGHIYMYFLQLYAELIALPPDAICIKCYDWAAY
jgi:hypothetical protein